MAEVNVTITRTKSLVVGSNMKPKGPIRHAIYYAIPIAITHFYYCDYDCDGYSTHRKELQLRNESQV